MAIKSDGPAPYAPTQTVMEIVQGFRKRDFPTPITVDVLTRAGVTDSLAPRTLQALKLLDLVNSDGMPTEQFVDLAKAPESEFPERFAAILRSAYQEVFQFVEPREDDMAKVRDAFRVYSPRGQQGRMVTLFLGLCEVAGLVEARPQRAHSQRKATGPNGGQRAPRTNPFTKGKGQREKNTPDPPPDRTVEHFQPSPPPATGQHPFIRGLIQELPPAGAEWSEAKRQKWADAALAAFYVIYELPPDERGGGGSD